MVIVAVQKKAPQRVWGLGVFTRGIRVLPSKPLAISLLGDGEVLQIVSI